MNVKIESNTKNSGLIVGHLVIENIENIENKKNRNNRMEKLIKELETEVKQNPESFLEKDELKAYEEFINSCKSAITSNDSAPRILVNIILKQGKLPTISRVVDCMNVVSIKRGLTISIWDKDRIKGFVTYKLSEGGEKYCPFMGEEVTLLQGELATFDEEKVLGLVRYRDSKYAPVTLETKNILVHMQGVGNISKELVISALDELEILLLENVGGITTEKKIINSENKK